MGEPTSGDRRGAIGVGGVHRPPSSRAARANGSCFEVVDRLEDSFALLPGESQWLMALMADDLARILADD